MMINLIILPPVTFSCDGRQLYICRRQRLSKKQADSSETLHDSKTIQHFPTPLSKKQADSSETRRPATADRGGEPIGRAPPALCRCPSSPMKFILKCSKYKQNPASKSRSHPFPRPKNELKRIFFQYTDRSSELCKKNHES